jgi:hypothetical protein
MTIKLVPPLIGTYPITQGFGNIDAELYPDQKDHKHFGVDYGCPIGTPVYASKAGKVVIAGWNDQGYGNLVKIAHDDDNCQTYYAHLSLVACQVNQIVEVGQYLGKTGNTGSSTGPHIHFELRINGQAVDPIPYLDDSATGLSGNTELSPGDTREFTADEIVSDITVGALIRVTATAGLRVRAQPSVEYGYFGYAPFGWQFEVTEIIKENEQRIWAKVEVYICLKEGDNAYAEVV